MIDHTHRCVQPYMRTERLHFLFSRILKGESFVTVARFRLLFPFSVSTARFRLLFPLSVSTARFRFFFMCSLYFFLPWQSRLEREQRHE